LKLLIADDEASIRGLVRVTLEDEGFDIFEAADGEAAMEIARTQHPTLILLDVMMPRLDGLEVCRRLKGEPATKDIVIVLLTAMAQDTDRERGLSAGADDYLTKPFSPLALLKMVEAVREERP
jgi:DNA-binding response OmpR family regulator